MRAHLHKLRGQLTGAKDAEQQAWAGLVRSLFRLNEFMYLD
jgi:hypothetical protein